MFEDIIEMLLQKKAGLRAEIEREFAARSEKIDALLNMAGYVKPVVEQATEEVAQEVVNAETAEAVTDEAVAAEVQNEQIVY